MEINISIEKSTTFEHEGKKGQSMALQGGRTILYFHEKLEGPSSRTFPEHEGSFKRVTKQELTTEEQQAYMFIGMNLEAGDIFVQEGEV